MSSTHQGRKCQSQNFVFKAVTFFVIALIINVFPVRADTSIGGPIFADTTWLLSNSPYIVSSSIDIRPGVKLTIEPGVQVKFNAGTQLQVNGGLIAKGTTSQPILFISNKTNPAPGDWIQIIFTDTAIPTTVDINGNYVSGSILDHCEIRYAGNSNGWYGAVQGGGIFISNSMIRDNSGIGINLVGTKDYPARLINNQIFHNNEGGVHIANGIMKQNFVFQNQAQSYAGGVKASNSQLTNNSINDNVLRYNGHGGGLIMDGGYAEGNWIVRNIVYSLTDAFGGGVYLSGMSGETTFTNNTISSNQIIGTVWSSGDGGGIYVEDSAYNMTISYNRITNNVVNTQFNGGCGGGMFFRNSHGGNILRVEKNWILYNSVINLHPTATEWRCGGGVYLATSGSNPTYFTENIIDSNTIIPGTMGSGAGAGIFVDDTNVILSKNTIVRNSIIGNKATGTGAYLSSTWNAFPFSNNVVTANYAPASSLAGGIQISGNSIMETQKNTLYANSPFDVTMNRTQDKDGSNNYWGTTSFDRILSQIFDWYDDAARGKFFFSPYLQDPDTDTPVAPPTNLSLVRLGQSITLHWDAVPSTNITYTYKIYYDTDEILPPFTGNGLILGTSPINAGNNLNFTFPDFPKGKYYFAVTATDDLSHESWYSNIVDTALKVYLPKLQK